MKPTLYSKALRTLDVSIYFRWVTANLRELFYVQKKTTATKKPAAYFSNQKEGSRKITTDMLECKY